MCSTVWIKPGIKVKYTCPNTQSNVTKEELEEQEPKIMSEIK